MVWGTICEIGEIMPLGPAISREIKDAIAAIWIEDSKQKSTEIMNKLKNNFPEVTLPSLRTVQNEITKIKKKLIDEDNKEWQLHDMVDLPIPDQAGGLLSRLWRYQHERGLGFSVLQARFAWIIHTTCSELDDYDVLSVATHYALERRLGSSKDSVLSRFLDGLMAYQPWISESDKNTFVLAVNEGRIPFPTNHLGWKLFLYCMGAKTDPKPDIISPNTVVKFPPPVFSDTKEWSDEILRKYG